MTLRLRPSLVLTRSVVLAGVLGALVLAPSAAPCARGAQQEAAKTQSERFVLSTRIAEVVNAPEFRAARWGIYAAALDSTDVLYELDQSRLFMPCSNMKLYSTTLALAMLGPDFRWRTSIYAAAKPDRDGRIAGDLIVYGRGDPTASTNFGDDGARARIELLADRIASAGVKRIAGDLIADESYFSGVRLGFGWEWNDLQWGYGAEISSLSFNDNVLGLTITPGRKPGDVCLVSFDPPLDHFRVINRTQTGPKGSTQDLGVYRAEASNVLQVWGHLPIDDKPFTGSVAVHDPAALYGRVLRQALERRKIVVEGKTLSIDGRGRLDSPFDPSRAVEIAFVESAPLSDVVRVTNKISQNLYAELLLRTVGKIKGPADAESADDAGLTALTGLLKQIGVDTDLISVADGSGLSRRNLVTPEATARLLAYAVKQPFGQVLFESLPRGGVEGTLENRFKDSDPRMNVRAKTGTLGDASALSGFLVTKSGRQVVFSIMVNNIPGSRAAVRKAIDRVVAALYEE